jgi:TrmH family RNA methyltransferase
MTDSDLLITSLRNPRVVAARKLSQRKQRQEQGRFLVEGLQSLYMALESSYMPLEVFYCEALFSGDHAPQVLRRFAATDAALVQVSAEVLQSLSPRDSPQGLIASFALPEPSLASIHLGGNALLLVLDRLRDPGNVGTLLRTADAAGAAAVILLGPSVDPYDPKTLRASMGSLFNLPVLTHDDPGNLFRWIATQGLSVIGADATRGTVWTGMQWPGAVALVLGNEAQGVSEDVAAHISEWVALPLYGRAESLNVAVAGGILMYAWAAAPR